MRIGFAAGTPEPALPSLRRLIDSPRHEVAAVLTRPDAASGRRGRPSPSPVARLALEHGIPVRDRSAPTPTNSSRTGGIDAGMCAVVAYGAVLVDGLLAVPKHGWINLHFSLSARVAWRGAGAGGDRAGDTVTGATTFQIEPALDSGPVYGVVTETIRPTDTAGDLLDRLSISGAALLETTLDGIADGSLSPVPQPSDGVTVAPKVTVDDARVRWDLPAHVVERRIRAVTPNPGAWTLFGELRVKLGPVTVDDAAPNALAAGSDSGGPHRRPGRHGVATGAARRIQPPGKKQMDVRTGRAVPGSTNPQRPHDQAPQAAP